jgi:hypothetical protein
MDILPIIGETRLLVLLVTSHHVNYIGKAEAGRKAQVIAIVSAAVAGSDDD